MKLKVDQMNNMNNDADCEFKTRKPAWNKAKPDNIISYINELEARLLLISYPEDALNCENVLCQNLDHKNAVDVYTIDVMEAISESVKNNIPHTNPTSSKKIIPGWNEIVKPYKENAKFWYAIWESADRPQNNNLHIIMKKTRNKFHYILRKAQKREKELRKDRFISECISGNVNNILQEIKETRKQNNIPTSVDGISGSKNIAEHFKNQYNQLYNTHDDEVEISNIKSRLEENIRQSSGNPLEKITPHLISKIIKNMKLHHFSLVSGG